MVSYFICIYVFLHDPSTEERDSEVKMQCYRNLQQEILILTTSGFYGTVIDITDDTVIVEFGSNKNCRIPMQKSAIAAVEKPEEA